MPSRTCFLFIIAVFAYQQTHSQDTVDKFREFESIKDTLALDDAIARSMEEVELEKNLYEKEHYRYYRESLNMRKEIFQWNHISSKIIFYVVVLIVVAGLCFSSVQFYISMLRARAKTHLSTGSGEQPEVSTGLKLSLSGLEVNSSVLGIIILVLSLAFFYLYLVYVYPVKEYNLDDTVRKEQVKI